MAPVTPTGVPSALIAGDTLLFEVAFPEHPASEGWSLSVTIAGERKFATDSGEITNDGNVTWTVNVPATRTRLLNTQTGERVYQWFAHMTGSGTYAGRRDTVAQGTITVKPNPATAEDGDLQAQCEKDLAVVEAAISGRLTDDLQAYTIRGRQVVLIPYAELVQERSRLKREVWRLKHPGQAFPSAKVVWPGAGY